MKSVASTLCRCILQGSLIDPFSSPIKRFTFPPPHANQACFVALAISPLCELLSTVVAGVRSYVLVGAHMVDEVEHFFVFKSAKQAGIHSVHPPSALVQSLLALDVAEQGRVLIPEESKKLPLLELRHLLYGELRFWSFGHCFLF